jgi:hypothetical protein
MVEPVTGATLTSARSRKEGATVDWIFRRWGR